jgi:malonyl CoA-acyl carrier protein transacylase
VSARARSGEEIEIATEVEREIATEVEREIATEVEREIATEVEREIATEVEREIAIEAATLAEAGDETFSDIFCEAFDKGQEPHRQQTSVTWQSVPAVQLAILLLIRLEAGRYAAIISGSARLLLLNRLAWRTPQRSSFSRQ